MEPFGGDEQQAINLTEHLDALYSYAIALSKRRTEAEDLVQETCLRAIRAMNRLRPGSNLKSWLFTILRNVWFNELRQRRSAPEIVELAADDAFSNSFASTAKDPYADYADHAERERVRAAIETLPVEFREIILLREYEELSYLEIAEVLECPPGTVMSRLARARWRLRDLLLSTSTVPAPTGRDAVEAENAAA